MSIQQEKLQLRSGISGRAPLAAKVLSYWLRSLLGEFQSGRLSVTTPGGVRLVWDTGRPGTQAQATIHSWCLLARLLSANDVSIAESYIAGEWSSPDLNAVMQFARENALLTATPARGALLRLALRFRHGLNRNTRRGSRRNIAAHYDLGNAFYRHWLDAGMNYSAATFSTGHESLETAQDAKIERICHLLDVKGGENVLEIGCGWGAVAERLVKGHDCTVTGITLSAEQLEFAQRRLQKQVSEGDCSLRLQDYRDMTGTFDRIASIEMLEAVGEAYWPAYFTKVRESLRPGGIAVLQVITIAEQNFESYRRTPDFIQKYIFPGGMLPTKEIIREQCARAGLDLVHQEFFGLDYARTLDHWARRFQRTWPEISRLGFDASFRRMWEYYLVYCRAGFESGITDVGLYKIVRR